MKKHHKKNNLVITTNEQLAIRIKEDFPNYKLKASLNMGFENIKLIPADINKVKYPK